MFSTYYAWLYSIIYIALTSLPLQYAASYARPPLPNYGWSDATYGLAYLSLALGFFLTAIINSTMQNRIYAYLQKRHGGERRPEYRLVLAQVGSIILPIGLLIWGWTSNAATYPAGPLVGQVLIGLGLLLGFNALQNFIVDASQPYSAAAIAGACVSSCLRLARGTDHSSARSNLLRSVMAAVLPLCSDQLFENLGWGWGGTLLCFVSLPILPAPLLLLKYGRRIRERYPIRA